MIEVADEIMDIAGWKEIDAALVERIIAVGSVHLRRVVRHLEL
jgi:hypothetical protein